MPDDSIVRPCQVALLSPAFFSLLLGVASMVLLLIAVIALLGIAALLWLPSFRQSGEPGHVPPTPTAPEPLFTGMSYSQAFDGDYALIWQTQVPALELVHNAGNRGITIQALRQWFEIAMSSYPDLFEGHTFEEWLDFLQHSRVVQFGNERAQLTTLGYELLEHCRMAG